MRAPLSRLRNASFDVAILGGGINGSSAAQHLVAEGYNVLLVDKGDFASGSSSRSSRLLHCGLRYLAPGRSLFDFVRHPKRLLIALRMARLAMQARAELVESVPTRTRAMKFAFPVYRNGIYRGWHLDAAFRLLKTLGPTNPPLDYRRATPDDARNMPLVKWLARFEELEAVALFREYQIDWPERLCIDNVMDAEDNGATVRNYTSGRLIERTGDAWTLGLSDMLNKQEPEVKVTARVVLNMGGVWIDGINRNVKSDASRKILGTKGAHILVKLPDECAQRGVAAINSQNEPFYCVPWRGYHYFGPTETLYEGDLDDVHTTDDEIDWLVQEANAMLPGAYITRQDVAFTWAGVRPLTYDETMPFGKRSRDIHDLAGDGLPNVFAMTMGSVMNHRSGGRDMTKLVASRLQPSRAKKPIAYKTNDTQSGVSRHREHAVTLYDAVFRRTGLGWEPDLKAENQQAVLRQVMDDFGWPEAGRDEEIAAFLKAANHLHAPGWAHGEHAIFPDKRVKVKDLSGNE